MKTLLLTIFTFLSTITCARSQTLHLYGGMNNKEYLGCLNCNKFSTNSVWNQYGTYGSKFSTTSIWNSYGTYGSAYSIYSPWNKSGMKPPIVVDNGGNFYGYFTINSFSANRADFSLAMTIYEYHELIMNDVSKWYDKIFE
jgi:hypothetical protein